MADEGPLRARYAGFPDHSALAAGGGVARGAIRHVCLLRHALQQAIAGFRDGQAVAGVWRAVCECAALVFYSGVCADGVLVGEEVVERTTAGGWQVQSVRV